MYTPAIYLWTLWKNWETILFENKMLHKTMTQIHMQNYYMKSEFPLKISRFVLAEKSTMDLLIIVNCDCRGRGGMPL